MSVPHLLWNAQRLNRWTRRLEVALLLTSQHLGSRRPRGHGRDYSTLPLRRWSIAYRYATDQQALVAGAAVGTAMDVVGFALALLGAITSVWFLTEVVLKYRRVSWRRAEKLAAKIVSDMVSDGFTPTLIVGIARGGAILGALIAGVLGHRPIITFTVDHDWTDGRRRDFLLIDFLPKDEAVLTSVLVVAGEIHSGNSMREVCRYLEAMGAKEIRRAVLYYEAGSTEPVEYVGFRTRRKMVRLPWMFTNNYRRLARSDDKVV